MDFWFRLSIQKFVSLKKKVLFYRSINHNLTKKFLQAPPASDVREDLAAFEDDDMMNEDLEAMLQEVESSIPPTGAENSSNTSSVNALTAQFMEEEEDWQELAALENIPENLSPKPPISNKPSANEARITSFNSSSKSQSRPSSNASRAQSFTVPLKTGNFRKDLSSDSVDTNIIQNCFSNSPANSTHRTSQNLTSSNIFGKSTQVPLSYSSQKTTQPFKTTPNERTLFNQSDMDVNNSPTTQEIINKFSGHSSAGASSESKDSERVNKPSSKRSSTNAEEDELQPSNKMIKVTSIDDPLMISCSRGDCLSVLEKTKNQPPFTYLCLLPESVEVQQVILFSICLPVCINLS